MRFGIVNSALWATVTTDTSCGAVNSMHDSYTPLGGFVPLLNMQIGEIIFGGVGSGLYGMLVMAVLSVFIAGLMVGRTPEYLGKKIEGREMKLAMLYILIFPGGHPAAGGRGDGDQGGAGRNHQSRTARFLADSICVQRGRRRTMARPSAGSTPMLLSTTGCWRSVMLFGRFTMMIPVLALAGSLAGKRVVPPSAGTFPTTGFVFVVLLVGVILIVAALTFFPADALGPIVEHLAMINGKLSEARQE